jgi:hypothetical protein
MPQLIIIVEKNRVLKQCNLKEFKEEDLYKKAGLKKSEGFLKQVDWTIKLNGNKYIVSMYGKLEGKANTENYYDFPPPIDNKLFFGNCILVGYLKEKEKLNPISLTLDLWEKLYEKLFGGFEDLTMCILEDEEEEDELENIPASKKTKKGGYLKDGFVIDSDQEEEDEDEEDEDETSEQLDNKDNNENEELIIDEIGSELSEELYDYSDVE